MYEKEVQMKKNFVIVVLFGSLILASNAVAKKYPKVDHCDYDDKTLVETCYGEDGNKLRGWAVEGEQPRSAASQRRKMRKNARKNRWVADMEKGEVYAEGGQTYTLSKFRDGKKNGLSKDIDYRGFGVKRVQYKNGVKNGIYEEYFMENHNRKVKARYKKGLLDGKVTFYNSRGQQIGKAQYKDGKLQKGSCKHSRRDKERYTAEFIKSLPENELVKCHYTED